MIPMPNGCNENFNSVDDAGIDFFGRELTRLLNSDSVELFGVTTVSLNRLVQPIIVLIHLYCDVIGSTFKLC